MTFVPLVDNDEIKDGLKTDIKELVLDWQSGLCLKPLAQKHKISTATAKKYLNDAGIDTSRKECLKPQIVERIKMINWVLSQYDKMTVRQIFYQLAPRGVVSMDKKGYNKIIYATKKGRKNGTIDWDKIVDRIRVPKQQAMWEGLTGFFESMKNTYKKDVWLNQKMYFEVWFEKMALYDFFAELLRFGIVIQPVIGYTSLSAIHVAATERFSKYRDRDCFIFYFGDHDPSGIDIDRHIAKEFHDKNIEGYCGIVEVERIGLNYEDIEIYNLPENIEKEGETRLAGYRDMGYSRSAELDSLPPDILLEKIQSVLSHFDLVAYRSIKNTELDELEELKRRLS